MATAQNDKRTELVDVVDDRGRSLVPGTTGNVVLRASVDEDGVRRRDVIKTSYRGFIDADGTLVLEDVEAGGRHRTWPLSFRQQGLWLFEQLHPGTSTYNISTSFLLRGSLHIRALQRAVLDIARRHEVLRTTFREINGEPYQVVGPPEEIRLHIEDIPDGPGSDRMALVTERLRRESLQPLDLESGPLMHVRLYRVVNDEHVLQIVVHHIVFDAWSTGVFLTEVSSLYNAYLHGHPSQLPDLTLQYADFSASQRERLSANAMTSDLDYWKRRLESFPSHIDLPTDYPPPPVPTFSGGAHGFSIPRGLVEQLRTLAREERGTLFMVLLAAFYTLLFRYSGQEELLVGVPVAGRGRSELEPLIGFFVNTLVLPGDLAGNPTFREVLGRTVTEALSGYEHQEAPFASLVAALQASRDIRSNGLMQAMFVFQNAPTGDLNLEGIEASHVQLSNGTAQTDLKLEMWESSGGLSCWFAYSTDLFAAETIASMADCYCTLLQSIVADPDQMVATLPLLEVDEQYSRAVGNENVSPYPDCCLHTLVAARARNDPSAVALITGDQVLSRGELDTRSTLLAGYLGQQGVSRGDIVGISMEPSADAIVGILGILKAGAAYMPLDPAYPAERLSFMLSDARAPLVITTADIATHLPPLDAKLICVDIDEALGTVREAQGISVDAELSDIAYLVYTSGSEGGAKGVLAPHRGAVNRLSWMWDAYPLQSTDILCLRSSLNFVDHVWEVFGALAGGVPLVIVPPGADRDPQTLVDVLARHHVSRVVLVPSLLRAMLDSVPNLQARLPDLRFCHSSGEALDSETLKRFTAAMPDCVLLNLYGSSEVAGDVTWYEAPKGRQPEPVPIGRPIPNTSAYVLDSNLREVPTGVLGELHIGGAGLARGYINRPHLTAEKFISQPSDPGNRLYRTGDLARIRRDGLIEYHGRLDNQVKIRGFRVEPAEIETVLLRHPDVRESAVISRPVPDGESRLVAYLVCTPGSSPTPTDLLSYLRHTLPSFMLPSAFVFLDALPLTPSGKLDRRALPAPSQTRPGLRQEFVQPRTAMEKDLADIWSDVLDVEVVGIHDDFFELGGHSLLAMRVIYRVRQTWNVELPLIQLFADPTIAGMAAAILESLQSRPSERLNVDEMIKAEFHRRRSAPGRALVPVKPEGSKPSLFFVTGVNDIGLYIRRIAGLLDAEQPLYVIQPGRLVQTATQVDIPSLAGALVDELKEFQPHGPFRLGGFCNGGMIAFDMARRLQALGDDIPLLLLLCTAAEQNHGTPGITKPLLATQRRATLRRPRRPDARTLRRLLWDVISPSVKLGGRPSEGTYGERVGGYTVAELEKIIGDRAHGFLLPEDLARVMQDYRSLLAQPAGPRYGGKLTLFWPEEDAANQHADSTFGWDGIVADVEVQIVPGGHVTCVTDHVSDMSSRIQSVLDRANNTEPQ